VNARRGYCNRDATVRNCDFAGVFSENARCTAEHWRRKCYLAKFARH
jgi:hypothetical protein